MYDGIWSNGRFIVDELDGASEEVAVVVVAGEVVYDSGGDLQEIVVEGYCITFEVMVEEVIGAECEPPM